MPHRYQKRIVIIDDYSDAANELTQLLAASRFNVKTARDGTHGIELVRVFLPKIVICDLTLADMSGLDVAHALRNLSPVYMPFLISMSFSGDFHTISGAVTAGFDLHLKKPIAIDQILAIVEKAYSSPLRRRGKP